MPLDKDYGAVEASNAFVGGPNQTAIAETFVNALVEGKPLADDGSLYSTVQDAENNASSWVFVPPATYNESVTIDTAGLSLVGAGYGSFIDGGTIGDAITIDAANVTVRNLRVETTSGGGNFYNGVTLATNSDSCNIHNLSVTDSDHQGIRAENGADHTITKTRTSGTDGGGINIRDTTGPRHIVSSCVFENSGNELISTNIDNDGDSVFSNLLLNNSGDYGAIISDDDTICISWRIINSTDTGLRMRGTDQIAADIRISDSGGADFDNQATNLTQDAIVTGSAN